MPIYTDIPSDPRLRSSSCRTEPDCRSDLHFLPTGLHSLPGGRRVWDQRLVQADSQYLRARHRNEGRGLAATLSVLYMLCWWNCFKKKLIDHAGYWNLSVTEIRKRAKFVLLIPCQLMTSWYREPEHQSPVSISDETSYCKISQSLEDTRFVWKIVWSLWNLTGSTAAKVPVTFQSDMIIQSTDLAASRLHEI